MPLKHIVARLHPTLFAFAIASISFGLTCEAPAQQIGPCLTEGGGRFSCPAGAAPIVWSQANASSVIREEAPHAEAISTYYPAFGNAGDVVVARTGDILVSLSFQSPGIQIFSPSSGFANPCGGSNIIGFDSSITQVTGMALFPDRYLQSRGPKQSIGVAVEQSGVAFLRADLNTCDKESIVRAQEPVETNCESCSPGSFAVAVTPNPWLGYTFVANEYGKTEPASENNNLGGTVGIIRTVRDLRGGFLSWTRPIPFNAYLYIPGASTIPGVTISQDGKYLYVVNEVAPKEGNYPQGTHYSGNPYSNPTGVANPDLTGCEKVDGLWKCAPLCVNEYGQSDSQSNNGVLTVIDVDKAKRGWGQRSIIQTVAAGCSPVRVVETADGQYIFVATRGGNPGASDAPIVPAAGSVGRVLVFDVSKLLSRDLDTANEALVNAIKDSGGTAPVGLALFDEDKRLAVANSNRFTKGATGETSVAIFNVSDPSAVTEPDVVCESPIFSFPRGVASDGSSVYVANFGCRPDEKNDYCGSSNSPPVPVPGALQVITNIEASTSSCLPGLYPMAQN